MTARRLIRSLRSRWIWSAPKRPDESPVELTLMGCPLSPAQETVFGAVQGVGEPHWWLLGVGIQWPLYEAEMIPEGVPHDGPLKIGILARIEVGGLHRDSTDVFGLTHCEWDVRYPEIKMSASDPTLLVARDELK